MPCFEDEFDNYSRVHSWPKGTAQKLKITFFVESFLTPAVKVTNLLSTFISLEMAERSEAKSAKNEFF
jgi:hypothetical protein